ncbi:hypothetical protein KY329_05055 [Candidatus Woesearchaeota archaeon]|nr:hypothetical protein [Candidatus Woesearchaeota archaeon]
MKKLIALVFVAVLLCASVWAYEQYKSDWDFPQRGQGGTAEGVARVSNYDPRINDPQINAYVYLEPYTWVTEPGVGRGGYNPVMPRGTCRVQSYPVGYGATTIFGSSVKCKTKDLIPSERIKGYYEVYLVDFDTEYVLPIGTMWALLGGTGAVDQTMNEDLRMFDAVVITAKPLETIDDPRPGPIAIIGPMFRSNDYYEAIMKPSTLIDAGFEVY